MSSQTQVDLKILTIWTGREEEWLAFKTIAQAAKHYGVSERTLTRHLGAMTKRRDLEKEERGYKKTFYRPYNLTLNQLRKSSKYFRMYETWLSKLGKESVEKLEKAIIDSANLAQRIDDLVCKEVDDLFLKGKANGKSQEEIASMAISNVLSKEQLATSDIENLQLETHNFFKASWDTLARVPCAGIMEPYNLISLFSSNLERVIRSYVDLWLFMYKNPGADFHFQEYIKKSLS